MSAKPWTKFNCYEALRVDSTATEVEIRRAFKSASQSAHPDRGGSHEAQIRVNLAYEVLSHTESRARHDRYWKVGARTHEPVALHFSGEEAIKNLWSGPGGGAPKLSDGRGSSGLATRIKTRLQRDRDRLTLDRDNRAMMWLAESTGRLVRARQECAVLAGSVVLTGLVGTIYPFTWFGALALACVLAQRLRGDVLEEGQRIGLLDPCAWRRLEERATTMAKDSVARDRARLDVHVRTLETISKLVLTPVRGSDDETTVVRRLLAVLFVQGFVPTRAETGAKRIVLESDNETAVLYFRHGVNQQLSLATVEKILTARAALGAKTIFIYNQGGLSKRASEAADHGGVRWVGLRELNIWARQIWASESAGPSGDILQRLSEFSTFLDQLSL